MEKELLRKLGEETIYTAKGHFKSCGLRRNLVTVTLWFCALLNVTGLIIVYSPLNKWMSAAGLFGMIALLIWNEGEGKDYRARHKQTAEKYLALHKEIRACYLQNSGKDEFDKLNDKVMKLDQSTKPDIPFIARKLAQKAIQKNDETDNWFLNEHK